MKISFLLLFVGILHLRAIDVNGQNAVMHLQTGDLSVGRFLNEVERQTNYLVIYSNREIDTERQIKIDSEAGSVSQYLDSIFADTDVRHQFENDYIILTKRFGDDVTTKQGVIIMGTVTDKDGPMPGVNVLIKGTATGVVTDANGKYNITVPDKDAVLIFSFVGYQTQEITVGDRSGINVILEEDTRELEEVVVVGYGVLKKKLVTGATSQVSGDDLQKQNTVSPMTALQSQSSGIQITKNSGQPGEGFKVYIRGMGTTGSASPLYVVDGLPVGDINDLNPSDIESIDILKDAASSAIYGARAANGVILVTTKQGKIGKPSIRYDGYFGVQNVYKEVTPLNAQQYAMVMNEARINGGKEAYDFAPLVPDWNRIQDGTWTGTNWMEEIINKNAPIQNHSLNITGGTEQSVYSTGISYTSQEGVFGNPVDPSYSRITVRLNSDSRLIKGDSFDILRFGETVSYAYTEKSGIGIGNRWGNDINNALKSSPFLPLHDANGEYHYAIPWNTRDANPIGKMVYLRGNNLNKSHRLYGNAYLILQPVKNLVYRGSFGVKVSAGSYRSYIPAYNLALNDYDPNDKTNQNQSVGLGWIFENTLNYRFKVADDHNFDALIGFSAEKNGLGEGISGTNINSIFSDFEHAYLSNNPAVYSDKTLLSGSPWGRSGIMSGFGRINYDYKEKYLATLVMRADGSSNFAPNKRWGYFPSISAGWVLTEESFAESLRNVVDFFKLRAGWGRNGNQSISPFQYLASISLDRMYFPGIDKTQGVVAGYPTILANPDVTWETSEQLDFGFDARFFKQRLGVVFDWYNKTTKDWLLQAPVLSSYGASAPYINGGNVRNRGVEVGITWRDTRGDFTYGVNANMAYNQNEVTKIANSEGIIHGPTDVLAQQTEEIYRVQVGYPMGYFWGYKMDGIFQNEAEVQSYRNSKGESIQPDANPGYVRFVNLDENNLIDNNDKTMIGNPNPDVIFSFGFNAAYKGFDFSFSSYGTLGGQIMKSYRSFNENPLENYTTDILNRWHGESTSNRIPRLLDGAHINWQYVSDLLMEEGSFWRISNVTLGYDFKRIMKKMPLSQLRFYVAAQNLFTVTKYTGMDPEVGFGNDTPWASGIDVGYYPSPRIFMFGLSIKY